MRSFNTVLRLASVSCLFAAVAATSGCRGWTSEQPPVHLNPNMDTQDKYKPYRNSDYFADGRAMRTPPAGTVARTVSGTSARDADYLRTDEAFYFATAGGELASGGQLLQGLPDTLDVNGELLARGQERYNIYCAPCHAQHGNGKGTVASRLRIKPPNFHEETWRKQSVSHFYRVITHGKPLPEDRSDPSIAMNMPSYAAQIPVKDRWAIALYVRALQQSQYGEGTIPLDGIGAVADATTSNPGAAAAPAAPAAGNGSTP